MSSSLHRVLLWETIEVKGTNSRSFIFAEGDKPPTSHQLDVVEEGKNRPSPRGVEIPSSFSRGVRRDVDGLSHNSE